MASLPSQGWWRLTAFADHWESPLIPWIGHPACPSCDGGSVFPVSPGVPDSGAGFPAGGLVQDSVLWVARPARRGFDRWPRGSPPLLPLEEAARGAFWETPPLYLQDENRGDTLDNHQEADLNGDGATDSVTLIHDGDMDSCNTTAIERYE